MPAALAPEVLTDPIGVLVDLIVKHEPDLNRAVVVEVVENLAGGRAKRRRLAQALLDRPAVLTDGRSPAPRAVADLLIALRKAGATKISPPVCADCGKQLRTIQRRGEHWYCGVDARHPHRRRGHLATRQRRRLDQLRRRHQPPRHATTPRSESSMTNGATLTSRLRAAGTAIWRGSRTIAIWVRARPPLLIFLVAVTAAGLIILLLGPAAWWATPSKHLHGKEKTDALNATRQVILASLGGLALLAGAGFTARTYFLARRGQLTDRYTKAITQLASDKITERLGGIYALEHLMVESERDHGTVVEVLAAFIRERTGAGQRAFPERSEHIHQGPRPAYRTLATDIQTALTVLGRRPQRHEPHSLNIGISDLCGADLAGLRLDQADFWGAKLRDAIMHDVRLEDANLCWAQMQDSRLGNARFRGAHLIGAQLQKATFNDADLSDAELGDAQLQNSSLEDADLRRAKLGGANLRGADLRGANLAGADFTMGYQGEPKPAQGLIPSQLSQAVLDETTRLPAELSTELLRYQRQRLYDAIVLHRSRLSR